MGIFAVLVQIMLHAASLGEAYKPYDTVLADKALVVPPDSRCKTADLNTQLRLVS